MDFVWSDTGGYTRRRFMGKVGGRGGGKGAATNLKRGGGQYSKNTNISKVKGA